MSDDIRAIARKRIEAKNGFKILLGVAVVVSLFLTGVWWFTGAREYFWPAWPMAGFAVALAFTGFFAYGPSTHITEADIDAEIAKLQRKSGGA